MASPILFKIDNDVFEAEGQISVKRTMRTFFKTQMLSSSTSMRDLDKLTNKFLKPRSRRKFQSRMRDMNNPINCQTLMQVLEWLWGQYGGRPTVPSPDSSYGLQSRDDGRKLTGNFPILVLIFMLAVLINSSTSFITQFSNDLIMMTIRILALS